MNKQSSLYRATASGRRPRSRRTATALTAAALGLALAAAGAATGAPASAATAAGSATHSSATVLRVEAATSFSTFNPFLAYFNADLDVIGSIYPTLAMINQNGQPAPYLATSWSTSPDKLTWTYKIRSGLKWTDGTPITGGA